MLSAPHFKAALLERVSPPPQPFFSPSLRIAECDLFLTFYSKLLTLNFF